MTADQTAAPLPAWREMSDLDKGAALLHLHKQGWEGAEYAIEKHPARYFDHPALTALSETDACRHAMSVEADVEALDPGESVRLYDLVLDAREALNGNERTGG